MARKTRGKVGRPPRGPYKGNTAAFMVRVKPELVEALNSAATAAGMTRSQFIQNVLTSSVKPIRPRRRDIDAILEYITRAIANVEQTTGQKWREDAFTSAAVGEGISFLLSHFGAAGAVTIPAKVEKTAGEMERVPAEYRDQYRTPEEIGRLAAGHIITEHEIANTRAEDVSLHRIEQANRRSPNDPESREFLDWYAHTNRDSDIVDALSSPPKGRAAKKEK
jgi:hypothetical protein